MMIKIDLSTYDKYVDIKVDVDGVKHDLGFQNVIFAKEILNSLEDSVAELINCIESIELMAELKGADNA